MSVYGFADILYNNIQNSISFITVFSEQKLECPIKGFMDQINSINNLHIRKIVYGLNFSLLETNFHT